ncbi:MAG TPA: hypothetical protein VM008_02920 [Phycisphaerae bacterium]|nr:hypothetical protein [Phycisphaerae bacterium]
MGTDVFVGNIDRNVSAADLEGLFAQYQTVQRVNVVTDRMTGQSKGFGFVTFGDAGEAASAIAQLNGFQLGGQPLSVSPARPKDASPRGRDSRPQTYGGSADTKEIYVKGLGDCTSEELHNLFAEHGTVVKAKVIIDRDTNRSKGFGYVQMGSDEELRQAIAALDGADFNGSRLSVSEARPRGSEGPRRGAGGGGGYGSFGRRQQGGGGQRY